MELFLKALQLAASAHTGQYRKAPEGAPKVTYINHPMHWATM